MESLSITAHNALKFRAPSNPTQQLAHCGGLQPEKPQLCLYDNLKALLHMQATGFHGSITIHSFYLKKKRKKQRNKISEL